MPHTLVIFLISSVTSLVMEKPYGPFFLKSKCSCYFIMVNNEFSKSSQQGNDY